MFGFPCSVTLSAGRRIERNALTSDLTELVWRVDILCGFWIREVSWKWMLYNLRMLLRDQISQHAIAQTIRWVIDAGTRV